MGVDPGYGTSKGAYVITQLRNGIIEILKAEEINKRKIAWYGDSSYLYKQDINLSRYRSEAVICIPRITYTHDSYSPRGISL